MAVSGMSGPVGAGLSYSRPLCDMNSALAMASWQYAIQIHLLNYRSRAGFQVTTCICEHRCFDGVSIDRWSCVSSDGRWWLRLSRPHRCHHSIEARWTWQPQLTALFFCIGWPSAFSTSFFVRRRIFCCENLYSLCYLPLKDFHRLISET